LGLETLALASLATTPGVAGSNRELDVVGKTNRYRLPQAHTASRKRILGVTGVARADPPFGSTQGVTRHGTTLCSEEARAVVLESCPAARVYPAPYRTAAVVN
jgi:hypothetical protein